MDEKLQFLADLLAKSTEFGATLKGRANGTELWFDIWGIVRQNHWVITLPSGKAVIVKEYFEEALETWQEYEKQE